MVGLSIDMYTNVIGVGVGREWSGEMWAKKVSNLFTLKITMMKFLHTETDQERLLKELLQQEQIGRDYVHFIIAAEKRGFSIEVGLIVDGQFCSSTVMVNPWDGTGKAVLDYLAHVGAGELLKIRARISELTEVSQKR
jgi:hypothetical protein